MGLTMNNFIPNSTQVPNIIMDDYMSKLNGAELKVLIFFIRQRYGFQKYKGEFSYSISQIMNGITYGDKKVCNGTGLSNRAVLNAIEKLKKYNLVGIKNGDYNKGVANKYSLNIHGEKITKITCEKKSQPKKKTSEKSSQPTSEEKSLVTCEESSLSGNKEKQRETNTNKFIFTNKTTKEEVIEYNINSFDKHSNDMRHKDEYIQNIKIWFISLWNQYSYIKNIPEILNKLNPISILCVLYLLYLRKIYFNKSGLNKDSILKWIEYFESKRNGKNKKSYFEILFYLKETFEEYKHDDYNKKYSNIYKNNLDEQMNRDLHEWYKISINKKYGYLYNPF